MPPDVEAIAEQVFVALADPTRRAVLAALASGGPATATDLAGRLPITRQAIAKHLALLSEAGLVTAEPGERRRVRYRLRSAPMQVAQQFLAALARDWDGPLDALRDHLDRRAGGPATTPRHKPGRGPERRGGTHDEDSPGRHAAGVGGGAPAAAGEGEGTDPRPGRAGGGAPADAVAGGGEDL
jgi:DNA-binding transcriptional ArsR family regulator